MRDLKTAMIIGLSASLLTAATARAELIVTELPTPIRNVSYITLDLDNSSGGSTDDDAQDRGVVDADVDFAFVDGIGTVSVAALLDQYGGNDDQDGVAIIAPSRATRLLPSHGSASAILAWTSGSAAPSLRPGEFASADEIVHGYVGLRVENDSGLHYGWAEITVDSRFILSTTLYLHAFAYETTPDVPAPFPTPEPSYQCWGVKDLKTPKFEKIQDPGVSISDRFSDDPDLTVIKPAFVCNVASIDGEESAGPDLCCYKSKGAKLDEKPRVTIEDAFGTLDLEAKNKPAHICRPCTVG